MIKANRYISVGTIEIAIGIAIDAIDAIESLGLRPRELKSDPDPDNDLDLEEKFPRMHFHMRISVLKEHIVNYGLLRARLPKSMYSFHYIDWFMLSVNERSVVCRC